jgi:hypothetical protein
MINQQVKRGLALYRLHDATRRQVRRDAEQQMDMVGPDMSPQDLNVERPADLPNQVPHLGANVTAKTGLRYVVMNKVIMHRVDRMGGSAVPLHGRHRSQAS